MTYDEKLIQKKEEESIHRGTDRHQRSTDSETIIEKIDSLCHLYDNKELTSKRNLLSRCHQNGSNHINRTASLQK